MKRLFIEIFILLIGGSIFIILALIGLIYTFVKHIFKFDYSVIKQLTPIIRNTTLCFDGFANSCSGELLNDILIEDKNFITYGKWYHTISGVTGVLQKFNKSSDKNVKFRNLLDKLLGKNHCIEAINEETEIYYEKKIMKNE